MTHAEHMKDLKRAMQDVLAAREELERVASTFDGLSDALDAARDNAADADMRLRQAMDW